MSEEKSKDLSEPAIKWFRNHGLFSDHFLEARLPQWEEWYIGEELSTFRQQLLSLYDSKKATLPTLNEAQTEDEFIKPVLELLGYANSYIVQHHAKTGKKAIRPDYFLFPDKATKDEAYLKLKKKENYYNKCIGIADAKYWERDLDLSKSNQLDTFSNLNPSFQIINYLIGTQQKWGILTNGRLWRLYSLKSHDHLGDYYQIDIVQLLEFPDEILKYFYLFFSKQALLLQADGKSFLDKVFEGSNDYAVELESDIKERAYEVVELLCKGFAAGFATEQLTTQTLNDIYDGSLILLYRLLFIFYAEARELLPLTTSADYRNTYSLRRLTDDIAEKDAKGYEPSDKLSERYNYLHNLFQLIDGGDHANGVPEYNGGLFDPQEQQFLEKQNISDSFLVRAIRHLAWVKDKKLGRIVSVDYNTLRERHLGSIYEGLLEFKPRIAPHDLIIIKDKNSVKYAPAKNHPAKDVKYHKGELYLANDKGERKATGSYYTPEYIVNYIVENTLDPLTKEAQESVKALKPAVDKAIAEWEKHREEKQGLEPIEKYDRAIAEEREKLLEPYLSLKVLDPAMGSGHFLARATDFLAEAIATDPSIEPPSETTEENELTYYRRRVVENCIYGVDLNPLAVELAKLTLWLSTMAKSKPLSFLNHHLRIGNSLIGARVADLDEIPKVTAKKKKKIDLSRAPVQLGLFQEALSKKLYDLLQNRALIAHLPTETLEDVRNKEEWERNFEHNIERFRTLADVWVSTYFGNKVRWDEYNTLIENLQSPDPEWAKLLQKKSLQRAIAMREERRFFHWELEFPEVFYDEKGNRKASAGFDAVVGNPPYDVVREERSDEMDWIGSEFAEVICGRTNLYALFIARSAIILKQKGHFRFIVPATYLSDMYFDKLRRFILQRFSITDILRIEERKGIFEGVLQAVSILGMLRGDTKLPIQVKWAITGDHVASGKMYESVLPVELIPMMLGDKVVIPTSRWTESYNIASKMMAVKCCLPDVTLGATTGSLQWDLHKHELRERPDRSAVSVLWAEEVQRYLRQEPYFRCSMEWVVLKSANPDATEPFLAIQRVTAIEQPRRIVATYIDEEHTPCFAENHVNYVLRNPDSKYELFYVLSLLNSELFDFFFRLVNNNTQVSAGELDSLPIQVINFTTSKNERKQLLEKGKELYQNYLVNHEWSNILAFVDECLPQKADGTPDTEHEKSDVVHDLLAFLAEEMTRLNKEKQSKIKEFVSWLEDEILKGSVEDQKNKTKIRNFHEGAFEELLDILKKNKTVSDPYPPEKRDILARTFSDSVDAITPLKNDIKLTDDLIDQIVYKLYCLTAEEIAIVEGATK